MMDSTNERIARLERVVDGLQRRLRLWRILTGTCLVLGLCVLGPGAGVALAEGGLPGLQERVEALEAILAPFSIQDHPGGGYDVVISGANLHIVNGLGATNGHPGDPFDFDPDTTPTNGLGNVIVGYNELRSEGPNDRSGSHNIVVGSMLDFTRFGGVVAGLESTTSGAYASVSGGFGNLASGAFSSVSGGEGNGALGPSSSVSGGSGNRANGPSSSVSGGSGNEANGAAGSVSGGFLNEANGPSSSVSGGNGNEASGIGSSVSGGVGSRAIGDVSSVSGGFRNTAGATSSSVSGGFVRSALGSNSWAAGALFEPF